MSIIESGLFKVTFSNRGDQYYKYEWEVRGVIAYAPSDFLPCVAYKPDNSIMLVKPAPEKQIDTRHPRD